MALNKEDLSKSLYNAEIEGTELTQKAKDKIKKKCEAIASAIDVYVKKIEVKTQIMPGSINTVGSPAAQAGPAVIVELSSSSIN
jgi:hypothetical protein